jgi:hypothetical protein
MFFNHGSLKKALKKIATTGIPAPSDARRPIRPNALSMLN